MPLAVAHILRSWRRATSRDGPQLRFSTARTAPVLRDQFRRDDTAAHNLAAALGVSANAVVAMTMRPPRGCPRQRLRTRFHPRLAHRRRLADRGDATAAARALASEDVGRDPVGDPCARRTRLGTGAHDFAPPGAGRARRRTGAGRHRPAGVAAGRRQRSPRAFASGRSDARSPDQPRGKPHRDARRDHA